jgi:5S rRNA maturation endonuclease (ribonuclease M5)
VIIPEGAWTSSPLRHYGLPNIPLCSELSGSWSDELADRIPTECRVVVKVDKDKAGEKYRDAICRSLSGRCRVLVEAGEVAHG